MNPGLTIVQLFYWLALAAWFGGVFFVTFSAPIIFRTIGETEPILPSVLSVNLEGQHGTLLGGSIVANLLAAMMRVQLACAAVLALCFIAHWKIFYHLQLGVLIIRTVLFLVAVALLIYDWRIVLPRMFEHRQKYIDHADDLEIAKAAREQFERYNRQTVTVLMIELAALLGLVAFSAVISTSTVVI